MRPSIPATYQNLLESNCGSFRYIIHVTTMFTYQTPTSHDLLGYEK